MKSPRKLRMSSMLSMAAATTIKMNAAHSAELTLYYDNINVVASDGTTIVQSYNYSTSGGDYSQIPTTFNIAVGNTFEFGIDAVVTNNINPVAGELTGTQRVVLGKTITNQAVQPSFLGLANFSIVVPSTDISAAKLVPVTSGQLFGTFAGVRDYHSTASLNNQSGVGTSVGPNNNPSGFVPDWDNGIVGDEAPMSSSAGDVGDYFPIFQGNGLIASNTTTGASTIGQYGAETASFGNATDFFDSLSYTAVRPGGVMLSAAVDPKGSSYWTNTQPGSTTVASGYISQSFNQPGDVIDTLPSLVVNILGALSGQSVISLTPGLIPFTRLNPPTTYGPSLGAIFVSGQNGSYNISQLTGLNSPIGYVEPFGFDPATDDEIYAFDILVNGVQANTAQIDALVNAINLGDIAVPASPGVMAADTYAGLPTTDSNPFASQYNIFWKRPPLRVPTITSAST